VTLALPFTPVARFLGLTAPRPAVLLSVAAIVGAYIVAAEVIKRRFYVAARNSG
jgi:hypothetical protein